MANEELDPQEQPEEPQPPDSLELLVDKYVNAAIDGKVMPGIDAAVERNFGVLNQKVDDFIDRFEKKQGGDIAQMFERIPTVEQIIERLQSDADQTAAQHAQDQGQTATSTNGNGSHNPQPANQFERGAEESWQSINDMADEIQAKDGDKVLSKFTKNDMMDLVRFGMYAIDWGFNKRMVLKQFELASQDPFSYMGNLYTTQPDKAVFLINAWSNRLNPYGQAAPIQHAIMQGIQIGAKARREAGGPGSSPDNPLVLPNAPSLPNQPDTSSAMPTEPSPGNINLSNGRKPGSGIGTGIERGSTVNGRKYGSFGKRAVSDIR